MIVLGLDTSTLMSTCSVIKDGNLLGEYSFNMDMSHSEKLVPLIKNMLEELKLSIEDIDLYGVSIGPGSFTGLRIGIATMKGFAHVFDKPIVGVSTLEALAYNMPFNEVIVPMIDARRERVYSGIYGFEGNELKEISKPDILYIKDLEKYIQEYEEVVVLGTGSLEHEEEIKNTLGKKVRFATIGSIDCRAASIGALALNKFEKGIEDDYYTLAPEYLRPSQAEREKDKK